jgi:hypothetical protein
MFPKRATSSRFLSTPKLVMSRKADARPNNQQSSFQSSYGIGDRLPDHEHGSKDSFSFARSNRIFVDGFCHDRASEVD